MRVNLRQQSLQFSGVERLYEEIGPKATTVRLRLTPPHTNDVFEKLSAPEPTPHSTAENPSFIPGQRLFQLLLRDGQAYWMAHAGIGADQNDIDLDGASYYDAARSRSLLRMQAAIGSFWHKETAPVFMELDTAEDFQSAARIVEAAGDAVSNKGKARILRFLEGLASLRGAGSTRLN